MATLTTPSGCQHCGLPERGHGQRWTRIDRWHRWEEPSMATRKQRMFDRALHDHTQTLSGSRWAADREDSQSLAQIIERRDRLRSGAREQALHLVHDVNDVKRIASQTSSPRGRRALEHLAAELHAHIPTPEAVAATAEEILALDREEDTEVARARCTLLWHEVFDLIRVGHGDPAAYATAAQGAYGPNTEWQILSTLGETE